MFPYATSTTLSVCALISQRYKALIYIKAWVLTVTEFATKEDRQRLGNGQSEFAVKILSHVIQWAIALSCREDFIFAKTTYGLCKTHLPAMACIVRSEAAACILEAGPDDPDYDPEDPGYLFAIGFSLPDTYARTCPEGSREDSSAAQRAKDQATDVRKRYLELMFGRLSGKTARQKIRCDGRAEVVKYGHCAETNALPR